MDLSEISKFCNDKGLWAIKTFGESDETIGPNAETITQHIEKECCEVRDDRHDLTEWVDIIMLAMDGYFRYGGRELGSDIQRKHQINCGRRWPDPSQRKPGDCVEHIKE